MERILELKYRSFDSLSEMKESDRELIEEARRAAEGSVSQYSNFEVGAAARLEDGTITRGANIESDAYPAGICAERNLLFHTAAAYPQSRIEAVAVVSTSTDRECYPCGFCRQTLLDSERRQGYPIRIIMAGAQSATVVESAATLLPFAFKL